MIWKGSAPFKTTSFTCSNARKSIHDKSLDFIKAKTDSRGLMGKQIVPNNLYTHSHTKIPDTARYEYTVLSVNL